MEIIRIEHGSRLYAEWVELRTRILREPLGLRYSSDDLEAERDQDHWVAQLGGTLVGGFIVCSIPDGSWKIRQVAVCESQQGRGIGKALMQFAVSQARAEGVGEISLHARESVIPFYEQLGFHVVGDPFEEVGIPHSRMILVPSRTE